MGVQECHVELVWCISIGKFCLCSTSTELEAWNLALYRLQVILLAGCHVSLSWIPKLIPKLMTSSWMLCWSLTIPEICTYECPKLCFSFLVFEFLKCGILMEFGSSLSPIMEKCSEEASLTYMIQHWMVEMAIRVQYPCFQIQDKSQIVTQWQWVLK
jgi:hypothetical protein